MILVDANLLVYAHVEDFPEHSAAHEWLDQRLNGTERLALPWPSILTFLRLVTNPRIFPGPADVKSAWAQVAQWLGAEPTWIPTPTDRHQEILEALLIGCDARADLVPNAHLAALAIEHGLVLCSTDRDFSRFSDLHWENPLSASGSK